MYDCIRMNFVTYCHQKRDAPACQQEKVPEPSDSSPDSSCEWCDVESSPPPRPTARPNDSTSDETRVNNTIKHKQNSIVRTTNNVGADADTAGSEAAVESHKPRVSEREGDVRCRRERGKIGEEEAVFDHLEKTTENVMAWITEVCRYSTYLLALNSLSLFSLLSSRSRLKDL